MGIQINGTTDTISAVDGSLDINQNATFGNNVTIGGTLTYSDVTNIDSVGLVTAKNGLRIHAGGIDLTSGISTFSDNIQIADKIIHKDDTDTAIRFPATDTFAVETGGSERFRIDSSGNTLIYGVLRKDNVNSSLSISGGNGADSSANIVLHGSGGSPANVTQFRTGSTERLRILGGGQVAIGTATEGHADADELTISTTGRTGMTIRSGSSEYGNIFFSDATSGSGEHQGIFQYYHQDDAFIWKSGSSATERLRIKSNGDVGIGTDSPGTLTWRTGHTLDVFAGAGNAAGQLYLGASRGDGVQTVGSIVFYDNSQTSSHQNIAIIEVDKIGSGTNTRGGDFLFYNKVAGGTSAPVTFKIRSGGNCEIPDGNLKFADGHGIDFSSTSDTGGMTNELLDDYEEGTFTPTIGFDSNSANDWTYNAQQGTYLKVGNLCHFVLRIDIGNAGSGNNGWVQIIGLPFDMYDMMSGISYEGTCNCDVHDAASNQSGLRAIFDQSTNKLYLVDTGGDTSFFASDRRVKKNDLIQNSTDIRIRGVYRTT